MFKLQDQAQPLRAGKRCRLVRGHLEHAPARRHRAMAKREDHHAARPNETRDHRHRLPSLPLVEMHPYGGEHHHVERIAAPDQRRQLR
jgi:hypothetical protein